MDMSLRLRWLAGVALNEQLLKTVLLLPRRFRNLLPAMEQLWVEIIEEHFSAFDKMPTVEFLQLRLENHFVQMEEGEEKSQLFQSAKQILQMTYHLRNENIDPDKLHQSGLDSLTTALMEARQQRLVADMVPGQPLALNAIHKTVEDLTAIKSIDDDIFQPPMKHGAKLMDPHFEPVGVDFLDKFCDGGLMNGEVVGHAAPIGSGKTTLVLQLAFAKVKQIADAAVLKNGVDTFDQISLEERRKLPRVYAFFYEPVVNLMPNFLSNAASIKRSEVMKYFKSGSDESLLSSKAKQNYKTYEKEVLSNAEQLAAAQATPPADDLPDGELDRLKKIEAMVNSLLLFVDFAGGVQQLDDMRSRGVKGMQDYIAMHQQREGDPGASLILCDYVGAMVDVACKNMNDQRNRSTYIRNTPGQLTESLANVFNCPVWAAHQLNPSENKAAPGARPNAMNAEGSGMFLERCAVGLASGMPTKEGIATWVQGKQRRAVKADDLVCRLDSTYARWIDVSQEYCVYENRAMSYDDVADEDDDSVDNDFAVAPAQ